MRPERVSAQLFAALLAAGFATAAPPTACAAIDPATERAAIARGDHSYNDEHDFEGALAAWRPALDADSSSYELCWRIARATSDRGARAEYDGDKKKAEAAFEQSVAAARRAVQLGPDKAEGHLELAVALGRMALFVGGKTKVRLSKEIKAEVDRSIAIDPTSSRAHHVLARWNRGIATLNMFEKAAANVLFGGLPPGASMDNAVVQFEKAIELAPDYAVNHLELGRTFLALKLKEKARQELEKALACPPMTPFDADYRREAKQLLGEVGGKVAAQ